MSISKNHFDFRAIISAACFKISASISSSFTRFLSSISSFSYGVLLSFTLNAPELLKSLTHFVTLDSRTPKADLVEQLAGALDVSTEALNVPNIDSYTGLMHTLFALEDLYGFKIDTLDGEVCIRINRQNGSNFTKIMGLLEPWEEMARKYRDGEITREEYDAWRYRYPRSKAE